MPYKILVVDDETDLHVLFRKKFREQISSGTLQFEFAVDGAEALEKLKSGATFHILFTDIKMPVMDGLTLLNHIKDLKLDIKTVVLSAYDDISNIRTAMNRDAFDFLVKPIGLDDLQVTLDKTIREYENYIQGIQARKKLIESVREKEAAILKERLRISRDLHDDIGATLSSISISSVAIQQRLHDLKYEEADILLNRISADAREMVTSLSDMVWLINPQNDSVEKLFDRIRTFASNLLSAQNIYFMFNHERVSEKIFLSIDERKNIFLIMKESINNAAKYSGATEIKLDVSNENGKLTFVLTDNGIGFLVNEKFGGNGIKNIQNRAEEINADLTFQSAEGTGTTVSLIAELSV
jgi:signal transduction histidine kinase